MNGYQCEKSFQAWLEEVERQASELNYFHGSPLGRTDPLAWAELRRIAKSVATWTWKHLDSKHAQANFAAVQRHRALLAATAKRSKTEQRIREAQAAIFEDGGVISIREVARRLGMSAGGLSKNYKHLFAAGE